MAKFNVLTCGGTVATASDTFMCGVAIRDGRIAARFAVVMFRDGGPRDEEFVPVPEPFLVMLG